MIKPRILCWFSCGAASAVATKKTIELYASTHEVVPVYCDTAISEHADNERFLRECQCWFRIQIKRIKNDKFSTVEDVFEAKQFMSGPKGAVCTGQLKKVPRFQFANPDDLHVFGFTFDLKELDRITEFEARNPDLNLLWVLRDLRISKQQCFEILHSAGIKLPVMYSLGFDHNNCLGCVKATSPHYWQQTRKHFPTVFERRAKQSRELGCRLVRVNGIRMFLDELPTEVDFQHEFENLSCGPECGEELK